MKAALAAVGFINENITHNLHVVLDTMKKCAGRADIVLFGEAFLQGFYAATFDPAHDAPLALAKEDATVAEIRAAAASLGIAVSFGFIEKDGDDFFSTQMTVGADGAILDVFRRVSPGWKLPNAGACYREGSGFHTFDLCGKRVAAAICGDLWFDENVAAIKALAPDVILWPVYTDFSPASWNTARKLEYAAQAAKIGGKILYVNAVCLDRSEDYIARGGAVLFDDGRIAAEIPSGSEALLFVTIP